MVVESFLLEVTNHRLTQVLKPLIILVSKKKEKKKKKKICRLEYCWPLLKPSCLLILVEQIFNLIYLWSYWLGDMISRSCYLFLALANLNISGTTSGSYWFGPVILLTAICSMGDRQKINIRDGLHV